jgi:hypothetical protein
MSIFLEITQLENGDIVLREADDDKAERLDGLEPEQQVIGAEADTAEGSRQKDSLKARHGSTARVREPLVRISFSPEVRDMLGGDLVGVAEAMIDAATDYLGGETLELDAEEMEWESSPGAPVIH